MGGREITTPRGVGQIKGSPCGGPCVLNNQLELTRIFHSSWMRLIAHCGFMHPLVHPLADRSIHSGLKQASSGFQRAALIGA